MDLKPTIISYIHELTLGLYDGYALKLEAICEKLGLACYVADFDDPRISGAILRNEKNDKFDIYVAKQHHPNRIRFTIAHEIGHYISYKNDSFSKDGFLKNNGFEDYSIMLRSDVRETEAEANQIAAEMLMPTSTVQQLVSANKSIEEMAELFFVSEIAMTIRLQNLYHNMMVT